MSDNPWELVFQWRKEADILDRLGEREKAGEKRECADQLESTLCESEGLDCLTDVQKETVTSGYEYGYYDIPRTIQSDELSAKLGITHQALSERFRRAHKALVERALSTEERRENYTGVRYEVPR